MTALPPAQTFRSFVREKRYEVGVGFILSVLGFILALSVNSWRSQQAEVASFRSIVDAIQQEAVHNDDVYRHSFQPHYQNDIVATEFSVSTIRSSLANPLFVRHADHDTLQILSRYLRDLELSNGFAETVRLIRTGSAGYAVPQEIITSWGQNLRVLFRYPQFVDFF